MHEYECDLYIFFIVVAVYIPRTDLYTYTEASENGKVWNATNITWKIVNQVYFKLFEQQYKFEDNFILCLIITIYIPESDFYSEFAM